MGNSVKIKLEINKISQTDKDKAIDLEVNLSNPKTNPRNNNKRIRTNKNLS